MKKRFLFVCMGNICRSPLGEGIFRHLVEARGLGDHVEIESAGTGGWHVGNPPDPRSAEVARNNGISLKGQSARKVCAGDFPKFDHILAMDRQNLDELLDLSPREHVHKIRLLRTHDPESGHDVPDPYYGGEGGFDRVYEMIHRCCSVLLEDLESELHD